MPVGMMSEDWNNKADVLWEFTGEYFAAEGIVRGSDLAQSVILYNFHGRYTYKRKIKKQPKIFHRPIVHALHFKLTNNRSVCMHVTANLL